MMNVKKSKGTLLNLKTLQQEFSESLLYKESAICSQLKDKAGFSADQLVQIHRNNFIISVTEGLRSTFKYTEQLVGDEFFDSVARQFILEHPPAVNNIRVYGEGFPVYLSQLQQLQEMPYIAEMAQFECVYEQSQNLALDLAAFDAQSLQKVAMDDYETLQFSIASHCAIFKSQQNIFCLLDMIKNDNVHEVNLNQNCYLLLQKKPNFSIEVIEISEQQWQLIQQLQQKTTLAGLQPTSLQNQLSDLLTLKIISGFTVNKAKEIL